MKRAIQMVVYALALATGLAACNTRGTTIINTSDGYKQEIKYWGKVAFTADSSAIAHISKNGYIYFNENGKELRAESDVHNSVVYSFNGESYINKLSNEQSAFLAHAVKSIIKERAKLNR
ncbi:hypothetical protein ACFQZX_05050 [Mucilaginibacter litoreus]|uniref:Lipoprotein n=1 Tax=Mucilaginibacter litoreus TaxID=1048221 RepID=A0ABW3AQD5_9SPHI